MNDGMTDSMSDSMSECMAEDMVDHMTEHMADKITESMAEGMTTRKSDRILDAMYNNQSEENGVFQIRTLGDFSVHYRDTNLTVAFENSQKLLELFTYFITYKNEHILPEKIIDELWPESDFSDPKRTLRALIFRLRKTLSQYDLLEGTSIITYSNGCYRFNAQEFCKIDIEAFEVAYKQAAALRHKNRDKAIEHYEKVIAMYNGGYLKKTALNDWLIPIKNQYHHMFMQSCGEVIDYLADEGRNQEIIELSEEIMRLDAYSEHINLHYVDSLTQMGELIQAKSHVAYVQKIFNRELGITSSEFIKKLNDMINQKNSSHPVNLEFKSNIGRMISESKGPIICNPNFFELYQKIEIQRSERLSKNMIWGTITVSVNPSSGFNEDKIPVLMEMLRVILVSNLRKGDVISQNEDMQFSISLSTDNLKYAEKVLDRIQKKFNIASATTQISIKKELYQYPNLKTM